MADPICPQQVCSGLGHPKVEPSCRVRQAPVYLIAATAEEYDRGSFYWSTSLGLDQSPDDALCSQRGGHIPGAANIPWSKAVNDDGTFKSADELAALYGGAGVTKDKPTIAYCRIGERSSHTWFVLKYLLGYPEVRNYDGSWTEWGSMVGQPIEK